ncbi:transmembrane and coiled-coil domains protein 1 [Striga asiatica]|uniref:Transmembrane and coiled-coil domains protein 1 n=1 Tax=Striga asiatica TaxID=4170 RepID=A0A5A7RA47_STRAF|nr:transmembrane and coiled-coil domains protein 1 [Striga asiatica]
MAPERELEARLSSSSDEQLPNPTGRNPLKKLPSALRALMAVEFMQISTGTRPVISFSEILRVVIDGKFMFSGKEPERWSVTTTAVELRDDEEKSQVIPGQPQQFDELISHPSMEDSRCSTKVLNEFRSFELHVQF